MGEQERRGQVGARTIQDFGVQWTRYRDNEGYYGSVELLRDVFWPLLRPEDLVGKRVAEIGSGTGRIVRMLLTAGVEHVVAIEPSEAFEVLLESTRSAGPRVQCLNVTGERLPAGEFDLVMSVGVLHHIPDPIPVVRAAYAALRPGGRFAVWLYGKEGNGPYLAFARPVRAVSKRLPHAMLAGLCYALDWPLVLYMKVCGIVPLPQHAYMTRVLARLAPAKRRLVIYDQLNPAYSKYYSRREAFDLLRAAGFEAIAIHHRHGYSWSLVGTKKS